VDILCSPAGRLRGRCRAIGHLKPTCGDTYFTRGDVYATTTRSQRACGDAYPPAADFGSL
jgi:hypothetical protein